MKHINVNIKKRLALVLTLALLLSGMAAAQPQTGLAKVKLNKTKATLTVGKTLKLKVRGAKKVKWRSSKKSVATVSSKGVVKAKKAGKAKITAKVKKKKFTCTVTVKNATRRSSVTPAPVIPTATQPPVATQSPVVTQAPNVDSNTDTVSNSVLAANLGVMTQVTQDGWVVFTVTNNNSVSVYNYTINYQLKDSSGGVVSTGSTSTLSYDLAPDTSEYAFVFLSPKEVRQIDVSKSQLSITVDNSLPSYANDNRAAVTLETTGVTSDKSGISATLKNNSASSAWAVLYTVFYDENNNIVGVDMGMWDFQSGETKYEQIGIPYQYDDEGQYLTDDDYNYLYVSYKTATPYLYAWLDN